ESGKKLSELADEYETYRKIDETNFTVKDKNYTLDLLRQEFSDRETDELDGLTVQLDEGWFNVRPSNTEPLLRLNVEAESKSSLESIVDRVTAIIKSSQ